MWGQIKNIVDLSANWLEAIGFLIVIFTAVKVFVLNKKFNKLNNKHLFQSRIAEHLKELQQTSKKTANYLGNFSGNIKNIRIEIAECYINCLSIKKKVNKYDLISLSETIRTAKAIKKNKIEIYKEVSLIDKVLNRKPIIEKDVDDFYEILTSLIKEVEHLIKDKKRTLL